MGGSPSGIKLDPLVKLQMKKMQDSPRKEQAELEVAVSYLELAANKNKG